MYVHNSLVAQNSKTLDTLINGVMMEATGGCATLDDVEVGTFVRFTQWLYTGSYDTHNGSLNRSGSIAVCHPVKHKAFGAVEVDQASVWAHLGWHSFGGIKRSEDMGRSGQQFYAADASKRQNLWATFTGGSSSLMPSKLDFSAVPGAYNDQNNDLVDVHLIHAELYVFADRYGVFGLQQAAIDNLKQTLIDFTEMSQERVVAFVDLIAYALENTAPSESDKVDKLRDLILQYSTICFEILFEDDGFKELLATNANFMVELMHRLMQRLD